MDGCFEVDPASVAPEEQLCLLVAIRRHLGWVQAQELRVLAAMDETRFDGSMAPDPEKEFFKTEIQAVLGFSGQHVNNQLQLARQLTGRLRDTLAALESGEISLAHAKRIADALTPLPDTAAARVQARVLDLAADRDLVSFGRRLRREVIKADPLGAAERARRPPRPFPLGS